MAESLYQQVVAAHRKTLDRLIDRGSVERLRNVYEKASAEVLAKLERLGRGSSSFTAHHLRMALAQLKAGQLYIGDQMIGELNAATREAQLYKLKMEKAGCRCDLFLFDGQKHGFFNFHDSSQEGSRYFKETVYQADLFLESLGYLKGKPTISDFIQRHQ